MEEIIYQRQCKEGGKQGSGADHSLAADFKTEFHRQLRDLQQQQKRQLAEKNPDCNAACDGDPCTVSRFPETKQGNMPLFQSQNVIESQFPLAPLHHKAVGVEQQRSGKKCHHNTAQIHQTLEVSGPPDGGDDLAVRQVTEDIVHGRGTAAGEQVRPVVPAVAQQIYQGQPGEKAGFTHGNRPPLPEWSGCRRCGGTGASRLSAPR